MGKLLLLASLLGLVIISFGTALSPQSPAFWLAASGEVYQNIRIILAILLVMQLMTNPPRYIWFRIFSGVVASVICVWAVTSTLTNQMLLLDFLSIVGASIAVLVTSLESKVPLLSINSAKPYKLTA